MGNDASSSTPPASAPGSTRTGRITRSTAADGMLAAFTRRAAVPRVCAGSGRWPSMVQWPARIRWPP